MLAPESFEKGTHSLVDLVKRLPPVWASLRVDHPVATYPRVHRVEGALGKAFVGSEAPFAQGGVSCHGKSERIPDEFRRLLRAPKVTRVDCPDPDLAKLLCHLSGLPATRLSQRRTVSVALNKAQPIPRALTVAHHPECPAVVLAHYLQEWPIPLSQDCETTESAIRLRFY